MTRQDDPDANPASLKPDRKERRLLFRREGIALGLMAAMMIGAWVVTLKV